MALFGFGKKVKNKQFDYIPRYYDPAKEDLEARLNKHNEDRDPSEVTKDRIRSGLRAKHRGNPQIARSESKKSNVRLIIIILFLVLITYMVMKSDKFLRMIEAISG